MANLFFQWGRCCRHRHTASTKSCDPVVAAVGTAFSTLWTYDPAAVGRTELITEHNVAPHVQVSTYMLPTAAQTGLTVKGSEGRTAALSRCLEQISADQCSRFMLTVRRLSGSTRGTRSLNSDRIRCLTEKIWYVHGFSSHTHLLFNPQMHFPYKCGSMQGEIPTV